MRKFLSLYGEFIICIILLIVFLTIWPYCVIAFQLNIFMAFGIGFIVIIIFNFMVGKRLKVREKIYKEKISVDS